MRRLLIALSILLLSVSSSGASAQAELPPLLILNDGGIYAISPQDGAILETIAAVDPANYFSAEWISPDGEILAYSTRGGSAPVFTHTLFLLNLIEGGDPITLTLTDDDDVNVQVDSVAWSSDSMYLYALITTQTPRQSEPDWAIAVFQRDQWDTPNLIPLDPPAAPRIFRSMFAAGDAAVVLDWSIRDASHEFKTYSPGGELLNTFSVTGDLSPDINLYANTTQLNPLMIDGSARYVFGNLMMANMLVYQADLMTGEISEMEMGYFSALISRTAPEASLRVSLINLDGQFGELSIRDADAVYLDYVQGVPQFAYGIQGDSRGSTFTLSPDGQALAFLREGMVNVWRDGVLTSLDVSAEVIAWQSPLIVPVYDEQALRMFLG